MSADIKTITAEQQKDAVISYLLLRQLIGVLGITLPIVIVAGNYFFSGCSSLQPSISHYYYTCMHIVFTGTLCVLGGFLITYKGISKNRRLENTVSNIAGLCALGVAAFPTKFNSIINPPGGSCHFLLLNYKDDVPGYINNMHYIFAGLLFACFAIFCFRIFQDADLGEPIDEKKKRRNKIYKLCGVIIVISIAGIGALALYDHIKCGDAKDCPESFPYSTFIFETTALLPFGFSWLLKGSVNWPHSKSKLVRRVMKPFR
jgi:hypothetical protein